MPLCSERELGPGYIVLDGDPALIPSPERGTAPPSFLSMSIVAKRLRISATAERLLCNWDVNFV